MRAIMIFIDGIGLGENNPDVNPFVYTHTPNLTLALGNKPLSRDAVGSHDDNIALVSLDATLGVPGLPQSATGQAALFTGENAPGIAGKHLNRYPDVKIKELLQEKGIFKELLEHRKKPVFINAFRPEFFADFERGFTREYSCSTMLTYYAGLPFRTLEHLKRGEALYMDITNEYLRSMGYMADIMSPEEAARSLVDISRGYDFTLFEYFLSDIAGHLAERERCGKVVSLLDRFIGSVLNLIDKDETFLIITSDHGNLEEISHKNHTYNPVPALISAPAGRINNITAELRDITGAARTIKDFLDVK